MLRAGGQLSSLTSSVVAITLEPQDPNKLFGVVSAPVLLVTLKSKIKLILVAFRIGVLIHIMCVRITVHWVSAHSSLFFR